MAIGFKIKNPKLAVKRLEREVGVFIDRLTDDLLVNAVTSTPVDKGRARRGWRKEKSFKQTRVVNRVPYINALEDGWSKQAPNGILKPAVRKTLRRR